MEEPQIEEELVEIPETDKERLERQRELRRAVQEKKNLEFLNQTEEEIERRRLKKELEEAKLKTQLEKIKQEPTEEEIERQQKKREIENLRLEANRLRNEKYISDQESPGVIEQAYNFRSNTKSSDKQFYNFLGYVIVLGFGTVFYWLNLERPDAEKVVVKKNPDTEEVIEKKKKDRTWYEYLFEKWDDKK
jgi:chromosome segregation ATPase